MRWLALSLLVLTGCPSDDGGGTTTEGETIPNEGFVEVGVGYNSACGLKGDGSIACWGSYMWDREPPANVKASVLAHGYDVTCWIDAGSSELGCTGLGTYTYTGYAEVDPPSGTYADVAVGRSTACALTAMGEPVCWNPSDPSDEEPLGSLPAGPFVGLDVGAGHAVFRRTDGTLETAGPYSSPPPAGTFAEVAAGYREACAVGTDGSIVCWVDDPGYSYVNDLPDTTGWQQIGAGYSHTCALADDGGVSCWGEDNVGQSTPPDGTFVHVAAGSEYSCGVGDDGVIQCWGDNSYAGSPDDIPAP